MARRLPLGRSGHPCLRTPHLDALAGGGVLFRRHFAQATPCGPARARPAHRHVRAEPSLGDQRHAARRAPHRSRRRGAQGGLPADPVRLHRPERRPARPRSGATRGFAPTRASTRASRSASTCPRTTPPGSPIWSAATAAGRSLAELFGGALGAPAPYPAEDSETAFLDRCLPRPGSSGWQEAAPWFAHLSFLKPHPPLVAPAPYHALYHPDEVPPPVRAREPRGRGGGPSLARGQARASRLSDSWYGKPAEPGRGRRSARRARSTTA